MRAAAPKNILITGATSGIGAALALEYARRGATHLFICGRDEGRLADVAATCSLDGVVVHPEVVDVAVAAAMSRWIGACDEIAALDLVVANAGIGTTEETEPNIRKMLAINVEGVLNTVFPALRIYAEGGGKKRNRRQIAMTSSIAGYHGMAACPSYSASKAFVKAWGAGLRGSLAHDGIMVNVICPGFVRSRITDRNTCPMPFFMEADKAARVIASRIEANVGLIAFPWPMRFGAWLLAALPERLSSALFASLPEKT